MTDKTAEQLRVCREAFEEWIQTTSGWKTCKQRGKPMYLRQTADGSYSDFRVNDRWFAYKSAWNTSADSGESVAISNLIEASSRAIPFLNDEARKYDDDGSNEPLEVSRDIEDSISSLNSIFTVLPAPGESALTSANIAFDGAGKTTQRAIDGRDLYKCDSERYRWLVNRVLYIDYGDNDKKGEVIGYGIRNDLCDGRQFMFGPSIDLAIDAAIARREGE